MFLVQTVHNLCFHSFLFHCFSYFHSLLKERIFSGCFQFFLLSLLLFLLLLLLLLLFD